MEENPDKIPIFLVRLILIGILAGIALLAKHDGETHKKTKEKETSKMR